ncbi:MAG: hypothetical protein XD95_0360 [Microgenomates bacterium 39_7]|nr:MAG: hypothetical protein XD95_0360 [Microgenomates bacterium 39_7]
MILFLTIFFTVTSLILPTKVLAKLLINEVLPNPDDEIEAIELIYVAQEDETFELNLLGWTISNNRAILHSFDEDTLIADNSFLVFTFYRKLLNTGDSVIIKDSHEEIVDEFHFNSTQKGLSYSRVSPLQDLFVVTAPSLGKANSEALTPTPSPTNSVQKEDVDNHSIANEETQEVAEETNNSLPKPLAESEILSSENNSAEENHQPLLNDSNKDELLKKIISHKEFLDSTVYNKQIVISSPQHNGFQTTQIYEVDHISPTKILSVIIGGLLFFISSRLIYE